MFLTENPKLPLSKHQAFCYLDNWVTVDNNPKAGRVRIGRASLINKLCNIWFAETYPTVTSTEANLHAFY